MPAIGAKAGAIVVGGAVVPRVLTGTRQRLGELVAHTHRFRESRLLDGEV